MGSTKKNKNPCLKNDKTLPSKTTSFEWMALWKFLFFIIQFCRGETDKVNDALFMRSSV